MSFLVLFCLLFLLVFAQAPAAQHTHTRTEPMKNVCFCLLDSGNCGFLSCLCRTHPFEGENPKFTSAQVCARSLSRREWTLSCQLQSMGQLCPFCLLFATTSLTLRFARSILLCRCCPEWLPWILRIHFRHRTLPI